MKLINVLILFLIFPVFLFSQTDTTITTLTGFEDAAGNTHLFYQTHYSNLGEVIDTSLSNIYHLNTSNLSNSVFLHGETHTQRQTFPPVDTDGKTISGLSFFNNDPTQYIYIQKSGISLSTNRIIKSGVGEVFSTSEHIRFLYISKQNPNNVYAVLWGLILKSTDGGNTWPAISDSSNIIINFIPIVFSPFDENIIFGFSYNTQLVKSDDGGKHSVIVQPDHIWDDLSQIRFDVNQENIYAFTGYWHSYHILTSQNNGDPFTWEYKESFEHPIRLKADAAISGSFYYSSDSKLYYSNDYGLTINELLTLDGSPVDFYQGQDCIYFAYANRITKINDTGTQPLINFPTNNSLSLLPLAVGNKWVYYYSGIYYDPLPVSFGGYETIEVFGDTLINNHIYYKLNSNNLFGNKWIRIDSLSGQILEYDSYSGGEYKYNNLFSSDLTYDYYLPWGQVYNVTVSDTLLWGKRRLKKDFVFYSLDIQTQDYVQGIGITFQANSFDFGSSTSKLQGCVINGIVYGDTLTVGVKEDDLTLPKEYKLYQNYPNPFNPTTTIQYNLSKAGKVELAVYDLLGRKVKTLANEFKPQGFYNVEFNADKLPSGVYIYRIVTSDFSASRKMILLK